MCISRLPSMPSVITDVWFVVVAPSFEEWGKFWDNYANSPAAEVDQRNEKVVCPDSALWESVKIK